MRTHIKTTRAHACMRTSTIINSHAHAHIHTYTRMHNHTNTRTHSHIHTHTQSHKYAHIFTHTHAYTITQIRTHIHTYTRIHNHTNTRTQTCRRMCGGQPRDARARAEQLCDQILRLLIYLHITVINIIIISLCYILVFSIL